MDVKGLNLDAVPVTSGEERITLGAPKKEDKGFASVLGDALGEVRQTQQAAEAQNQRFTTTEMGKIHENMIALEKANVTLRMVVSVRNRVVEAYRDLMHMS